MDNWDDEYEEVLRSIEGKAALVATGCKLFHIAVPMKDPQGVPHAMVPVGIDVTDPQGVQGRMIVLFTASTYAQLMDEGARFVIDNAQQRPVTRHPRHRGRSR